MKRRWSFGKLSTHNKGSEEAGVTSPNRYTLHHSDITPEEQKPSVGREFNNEENTTVDVSHSVVANTEVDTSRQTQAAIVIQTAFRGYLVLSYNYRIVLV